MGDMWVAYIVTAFVVFIASRIATNITHNKNTDRQAKPVENKTPKSNDHSTAITFFLIFLVLGTWLATTSGSAKAALAITFCVVILLANLFINKFEKTKEPNNKPQDNKPQAKNTNRPRHDVRYRFVDDNTIEIIPDNETDR